jgi:hypothetical protein
MKKVIDKCAGFNIPQTLLDLFINLKGILGKYVEDLTRVMPLKPKMDQDYQLLCSVANTSSLLLSIIDSLATKILGLIADEMKPAIKVEDAKDTISTELRRQLAYIVDVVVKEMEAPLFQIGNNTWDQSRQETGKVPQRVIDTFRTRFQVIDVWLSNDNMNRIRSLFAQRIVAVVHDAMFRQRQMNLDSGSRILVAVRELKNLVVHWTQADSALARKRIENEFLKLEVEITVVSSPEVAMTVTYITMFPHKTKEHYRSILRLRGFPASREQRLLVEYDDQLAKSEAPSRISNA